MKQTKILVYLLATIMLATTVYSQELETIQPNFSMCSTPLKVGVPCIITTPTLNCSFGFTYDVINLSGNLTVNNGSLARLHNDIFFLNFTDVDEKNDFTIRLCDGSTREIRVISGGEGGVTQADMVFIAIAIIFVAVLAVIIKASFSLDDEKHWQLKMGLFYGGLALGWAGLNLTLKMAEEFTSQGFQNSLVIIYGAYTIIGVLAVIYLAIIFFRFTFLKFLAIAKALTKQKDKDEDEDQVW